MTIPTTPQPVTSLGQLLSPGGARPLYVYEVPASLDVGVRSLGLVELTAGEELMAAKRASGDSMRLAYELSKEALRRLDDRALSAADGSIDVAWSAMSPKLRNLVLSAYNDLHAPAEAEVRGFLKSRTVQVG